MSEREYLHRWLVVGARRERIGRLLRAAGSIACIGAAAWLAWQSARVSGLHPHVVSALLPLLVLAALGAGIVAAVPAARRIGTQHAARLADARADLHDTLTSAQWFGARHSAQPAVELLLQRAHRSLQRLDRARVFPLRAPRRFVLALALGGCALALGWNASPPSAAPGAARAPTQASGARPALAQRAAAATEASNGQPAAESRADGALAAQLESLAAALGGRADLGALRAALASGDRSAAARQAQALARKLESVPEGRLPEQEEKMNAEVAASILERLQQLLREQTDPAGGPAKVANALESTAQLTRQLRQEMSVAPPPAPAPTEHLAGATDTDRNVRVLARSSPEGRSAVAGDGEEEAQGGNARLGGGAMGRRVGQSRAGAGDGDQDANANPEGSAQAGDVLGRRTQRLQTQLQQVRVERDEAAQAQADAPEDDRYVLTQWESAQRAYADVAAQSGRSAEAVSEQAETPLAWRESVRQHSLIQHRRDAAGRAQADE